GKIASRFLQHLAGRSIVAPGGLDHCFGRDIVETAASDLQHLRRYAGCESRGPASDARTSGLSLQAARLPVQRLLVWVHRQPPDRAGDAAGPAAEPPAAENSRSNASAHGYKNDVGEAARDSRPLLAKHVRGAVAVNHHGPRKLRLQLAPQRDAVPAGQIGRPDLAAARVVHAGDI